MNPVEQDPWRRELARRIRDLDVGPTGLAVHAIRATAGGGGRLMLIGHVL